MKTPSLPLSGAQSGARGFTLYELLVVIAILGVLAALLLPVLARAKALSQNTVCLNHLRQWNLALTVYVDENGGFTPRESFIPGGTRINLWGQIYNGLANDVWYNALPEYAGQRRAAYYAPLAARPDFYRHNKLFHCPSAKFPKGAAGDDLAFFSLAMNSKLTLRPALFMKFDSIERPSRTVTFLEGRLPGEARADPGQKDPDPDLGQPSAFASRFVTRHQQRGNLAFADGHQESLLGPMVVSGGLGIVPQTKIVWTADSSLDPNIIE
jgi:prepilin-type N-terminal cleavage/methylation domain-containing protein/prepilin-type processing-associated H-X9-DG protein